MVRRVAAACTRLKSCDGKVKALPTPTALTLSFQDEQHLKEASSPETHLVLFSRTWARVVRLVSQGFVVWVMRMQIFFHLAFLGNASVLLS